MQGNETRVHIISLLTDIGNIVQKWHGWKR